MKSTHASNSYVAFLQGINIDGKPASTIRMDELRNAFKIFGFRSIETISVTGNVLFQAPDADVEELANSIERNLRKRFNMYIPVAVRRIEDIERVVNSEPFQNIEINEETRLFVSFLCEPEEEQIKRKGKVSKEGFRVLKTTEGEVYSVLQLSQDLNTNHMLEILEKEFGKRLVTKNWNTVLKTINK